MLYVDTSALIKVYVQETGSAIMRQKLQDEEMASRPVFTSVLTFAEVHAALVQRRKDRSLSNRALDRCQQTFDTDWATSLSPIALTSGVLLVVREVVWLGLKGADAVHLASAMWLRDSVRLGMGIASGAKGDHLVFVTSDKRQVKAASAKNFQVLNPEDQP